MADINTESAQCYQAKSGYVLREIAGEYLLIPVTMQDGAESRIAVLNEVGQFLWQALQQERSIEELTQAVTESYEVSAEEARSDVIEFVNQLRENQLIIKKMEVTK